MHENTTENTKTCNVTRQNISWRRSNVTSLPIESKASALTQKWWLQEAAGARSLEFPLSFLFNFMRLNKRKKYFFKYWCQILGDPTNFAKQNPSVAAAIFLSALRRYSLGCDDMLDNAVCLRSKLYADAINLHILSIFKSYILWVPNRYSNKN